jgi:osmotically-inducible protein OsmY
MKLAHRFSALATVAALMLTACAPTETSRGTGQYIDDTAVTARVKAALANDPVVKATDVQVETFKGVVQLSGFVDSRESARQAVRLAREVPGVKDVKNSMVIK